MSLQQALPIFNDFRVSLISCSVIIKSDKNELVLGVTDGVLRSVSSTEEIEQKYSFKRFAFSLLLYTKSFKLLSKGGGIE
jgi:hypothetical protein